MDDITDIATYLRAHAQELGDRILQSYPPLHAIEDPPSPLISKLLSGARRRYSCHSSGGGNTFMRIILKVSSSPRRDRPIGI
jgi:hypothetical protein